MSALVIIALSLQLAASNSDDLLLKVGDPAPPFSMRDLDRQMFVMSKHVGNDASEPKKAIVAAFFATWCKPCMKEIPIVKKLYRRWKGKGVEVIYIGLSQGAKELKPFAQKKNLPWRVLPDSFGLLSRRYGASQLPHLFIIDGAGKIAFQHRGIADDLATTLDRQLARVTGDTAAAEGAEPESVVKTRFDNKYTLARAPASGGAASRWQPLATFVGEQVDAAVEVTAADSYEAFEEGLRKGTYELANAGPLLCHTVRDTYEPLVRLERQGTPGYLGILFTLRKSGIADLSGLKGKTVALVAPGSSSGGLYPLKALRDAGLVPDEGVTIKWVGSHSKVAAAVKAGEADAGGCFEDCRDMAWSSMRRKAAATRILSYTDQIPSELIIVRKDLSADLKKKLKKALLAANKAAGILTQISQGELTVSSILEADATHLEQVAKVFKAVSSTGK